MRKDITVDGLNKTTYMKDDMEGKIAVKEEVNIDPHLKHNKRLLNLNDGYSKSRDLKRVANITTIGDNQFLFDYLKKNIKEKTKFNRV